MGLAQGELGIDVGAQEEPVAEALDVAAASTEPAAVAEAEAEPAAAKAEAEADSAAAPAAEGPEASGEPESEAAAPETGDTAKTAPEGFTPLQKPDGEADDLKKISGVEPVLEKKLNELGIYHYRQIADLSAADIAHIDEALGFKGRIERDEWLKQAMELMQEKA